MSIYEFAILGSATCDERAKLTETIAGMVEDFDLELDRDVVVHNASTVHERNKRAAFASVFFGGPELTDLETVSSLEYSSGPIIPIVSPDADISSQIPEILQSANALKKRDDDPDMTEVASALLECVGLLRKQRRVFVSYRRTEARAAAVQLHDTLSARGFDVFLDTHDIRPGEPFQDVLWHRLVDSDVMVMLDTPTYFESRWTRQEIGRARAKDIQVLRLIWPEHTPNKHTELSETIYLENDDLNGPDGPIADLTVDRVVLMVEKLRSQSIASRYLSITSKLRADVEKIGGSIEGVGANRAVSVRLFDDQLIWAFPVVGIPTAEILNEVADKAEQDNPRAVPILVYDHIGIRETWNKHLRWLDEQISAVRSIKVSEAGWTLAAWED